MADSTDYLKDQFVNWVVGGNDFPAAHTDVYVALHDGDPGSTGENNELSFAEYSRVQTAAGTDWLIDGPNGTFENDTLIEFPVAEQNWGTITYFSIWDADQSATEQNCLGYSDLASSVDINEGDAAVFRTGNLSGELL